MLCPPMIGSDEIIYSTNYSILSIYNIKKSYVNFRSGFKMLAPNIVVHTAYIFNRSCPKAIQRIQRLFLADKGHHCLRMPVSHRPRAQMFTAWQMRQTVSEATHLSPVWATWTTRSICTLPSTLSYLIRRSYPKLILPRQRQTRYQ